MIPVRHVEEMYASAINGARSLGDTRHRGAGKPYRRAFELLRFISELEAGPGDVSPHAERDEWGEFEPRLASALAAMSDGEFLVIDVVGQRTFVQFAQQKAGMRAEVSSNAVLPPQSQLTRPQIDRLLQLGWRPPTGTVASSTPEDDAEGSPNFFLDLPAPVDTARLAKLAVSTFVEVLQVPYPSGLIPQGWAEPMTSEPPESAGPSPTGPTPETPDSVRAKVREIVRELLRDPTVDADGKGDFQLRVGSAAVYIRPMDDMPAVAIFSPVLTRLETTDLVLREINELNKKVRFARLLAVDDAVIAATEVHVEPFVWPAVQRAITGLLHFADDLDNRLQAKIGGTLASGETLSSSDARPMAGYL
jgi:hypothetical protein